MDDIDIFFNLIKSSCQLMNGGLLGEVDGRKTFCLCKIDALSKPMGVVFDAYASTCRNNFIDSYKFHQLNL